MGKTTGIAYADSTRNAWSGCTKISPGCNHCYAEAFQRFVRGKNPATGEAKNWGAGAPRVEHLQGFARDLWKWNRQAEKEIAAGTRERWIVFVNTQSDFFDNEVPQEWRDVAWSVIRDCTSLMILLVTKRIGNAHAMLPADWGGGYRNVCIIATIVNREEADRDLVKLMRTPARWRGVSYEPALEFIDWAEEFKIMEDSLSEFPDVGVDRLLDWLIIGGESDQGGAKARPFDLQWARMAVTACATYGVACFMKQLGAKPYDSTAVHLPPAELILMRDPAGENPNEWPEELRVREYPA